jgi:hypothetical protein
MSTTKFNEEKICSWQEFVTLKSSQTTKRNLYRGLPNKPKKPKEIKWKEYDLKTTYQRKYESPDITKFYRKLEDFQRYKDRYETIKKYPVGDNTNLLPLILYLRHAGIPMPVLDLTFNPLTALYFAVHDLYNHYGVRDTFENILKNNTHGYVSIFEFDIEILKKYYGVKELKNVYKFQELIDDKIYLIEQIENLCFKNQNMINQEGAFIFLSSAYPIDIFIRNQQLRSIDTGSPFPTPITLHKISYESIFTNGIKESVYAFLEKNNKVGYKLFSDEQALSFDFTNPSLIIE